MIYDDIFLQQLENQQQRVIYARITVLTKDEREAEQIEGRVTKGNINIDGKSSVRRTCTISLVTNTINISNYLWSLSNKFRLEVGLENTLDHQYPEIIWFPQGVYVITSFSSALSKNSYTINISGKDKMCLLNGEVGGIFNSQIDFGKIELKNTKGEIISNDREYVPIKYIIREMIHQYGGEPFHNIIVNDLDDLGLQLLEYRFKDPLYIWRKINDDSQNFFNGTINPKRPVYIEDPDYRDGEEMKLKKVFISQGGDMIDLKKEIYFVYDPLTKTYDPTPVRLNEDINSDLYAIAKINYGETAGYKETELVYPGDLIAKAGENITSVLEKIKKMLVFYEYYYNVEGQFVFQKKRDDLPVSYAFEGNKLVTSFSNTPDLKNAKNDFSVWGVRSNQETGAKVPIHMRVAIQRKPKEYKSIEVTQEEIDKYNLGYGFKAKPQKSCLYTTDTTLTENESVKIRDWRELIYQMSLDYRKFNHLDNFELKIAQANPTYFSSGKTYYEQFYIDMEAYWRQIYNPEVPLKANEPQLKEDQEATYQELKALKDKKDRTEEEDLRIKELEQILSNINEQLNDLTNYYAADENTELKFWNREFTLHPENFNFNFDLIDSGEVVDQFSVEAIGNRPKAVNNDKVKAISYREIPWIIFGPVPKHPKTGYRYFNVKGFESAFSTSRQGKSAEDEIKQLLNNHSYCLESVTMKAIPVYRLTPNTLISINDLSTGISGNYNLKKCSIALGHQATMNIVATKDTTKIY